VVVVFVFDPKLLQGLPSDDRRFTFLHQSLEELDRNLQKKNSCLLVRVGDPCWEIPALAKTLKAKAVCTGRDFEPYAKERDARVEKALEAEGIAFHAVKDQVIFAGREVATGTGAPYKVFTPYKNAWLRQLGPVHWEERRPHPLVFCPKENFQPQVHPWQLKDLGFRPASLWLEAGESAAQKRLKAFASRLAAYGRERDFPAAAATSGLSAHLRFGTLSVRACVRLALEQKNEGAETWLSELIWRDFYQMVLDQYPHVVGHAFKKEYDKLPWPGSDAHFRAWCAGETGYPLVDAAMRHFNATGWMHNRLRMVVASFLTKDLLVDWRRGEGYFARGLLDFDLAANNGGWQWSASTGCDAQPYFRIFNPYSQSKKFDPGGAFIRQQLPELNSFGKKEIHRPIGAKYPRPLVDHGIQRAKALALFKQ
jgi:deoxyribodipyrimidine photo-lyase